MERSLKAAESQLRPLGGTHGACTSSLYNLLHVITSENLKHKKKKKAWRDTHIKQNGFTTTTKGKNKMLLGARQLFSSALWVGIQGTFIWSYSNDAAATKNNKKQAALGAKAAVFVSPPRLLPCTNSAGNMNRPSVVSARSANTNSYSGGVLLITLVCVEGLADGSGIHF